MNEPQATAGLGSALNHLGRWVSRTLVPSTHGRQAVDGWVLWHAACAGDADSATRLVRQLTPQAHGLAMQMLARHEDAEDVVQEAFLRLWGSRPSDAHGATLATFFNTIVINRCKSWLTKRRELSADHEQLTEMSDAQQSLQRSAEMPALDSMQLQAAVARLPARQRMALAMWAYADADVADIARSLELDTNAAHQLLYRAKTALKILLKESPP